MCAPQAIAGLGPRPPRRAYGLGRRAMALVNTRRRIVTALTTLIVIGSAAVYVLAQPAGDGPSSVSGGSADVGVIGRCTRAYTIALPRSSTPRATSDRTR